MTEAIDLLVRPEQDLSSVFYYPEAVREVAKLCGGSDVVKKDMDWIDGLPALIQEASERLKTAEQSKIGILVHLGGPVWDQEASPGATLEDCLNYAKAEVAVNKAMLDFYDYSSSLDLYLRMATGVPFGADPDTHPQAMKVKKLIKEGKVPLNMRVSLNKKDSAKDLFKTILLDPEVYESEDKGYTESAKSFQETWFTSVRVVDTVSAVKSGKRLSLSDVRNLDLLRRSIKETEETLYNPFGLADAWDETEKRLKAQVGAQVLRNSIGPSLPYIVNQGRLQRRSP